MKKEVDVKSYRDYFIGELKKQCSSFDNPPKLVVVQVKGDMASDRYVANKERVCAEVGVKSEVVLLENDVTLESLKNTIIELNKREDIDGLMLQLPLPRNLKPYTQELCNLISCEKDVDGLSNESIGRLWSGSNLPHHIPCTAYGCLLVALQEYWYDLSGRKVCVVGRSNLVGKPVSALFQQHNATVTMCHSGTLNIENEIGQADIVILATGQAEEYNFEIFKDGALVLDVGINRDEDGKLCGDLNAKGETDKKIKYTPVPRGIGIMTVAVLVGNTIMSAHWKRLKLNQN